MKTYDLDLLDLFSGVGGWLEAAKTHHPGVVSRGIDIGEAAVTISAAAGHDIVRADLRTLDPMTWPSARVLAGSAPCQGMSIAGSGHGRRDVEKITELIDVFAEGCRPSVAQWNDERSELTAEPMRWIHALDPEAVVFEQVPAVLPVWDHYAKRLAERGYSVWAGILSAERFGTPQSRRRAVLIASRVRDAQAPEERPRVSMHDALAAHGVLPEQAGGHRPRLRSNFSGSGPGRTARERGRTMRTLAEASVTISGKFPQWCYCPGDCNWPGYAGPVVHTRLTPAQGGVLQGFAGTFPWMAAGKLTEAYQAIGNAVPVPLAAAVLSVVM